MLNENHKISCTSQLSVRDRVVKSGRKYLKGDMRFSDRGLVFSFSAFLFCTLVKGFSVIGFRAKSM